MNSLIIRVGVSEILEFTFILAMKLPAKKFLENLPVLDFVKMMSKDGFFKEKNLKSIKDYLNVMEKLCWEGTSNLAQEEF